MIEKLPFTEIHSGGADMVDRVEFRPVSPYEMQHKINELVDAVNAIQINNLSPSSSAPLSMTNDYTVIKYDELCRLRDAADELARLKGLKGLKGFQN